VLVNSAPFSGPIPDTARDLKIGTNLPMQTDEWFNGLIDELKIYNRALSASEIQAEYEANKLSDMLLNMTFDDGTAADSSEYHNDGTISGATSADSPIANGGKALSFDGANDWVSVGGDESQFDITYKKLTVSAWIKADTNQPSPDGYYLIIDKSHGAVDNTGWFMQGDLSAGGTVSFGYGDGAVSWPGVPTSMSLLDNTWHHLVGVYNTTTLKIYVDGILDNSVPANSLPLDNDRPVDIGSHWGGGARQRYFKGEIDEIKIWSRALSADEINQEYETNKLISGEPDNSCDYCANNLSYWDINSGTDCSPMYSKNFTWENTIPAAQKYCCGDDSNEYYLTRDCTTGVCSSSGTDVVCCDNPTDCVYNNTCYAIGDTFDLTNDGDKEICSADGWIDGDSSEANCTYLSGNPRDTRWMTGAACGRGNCNDVNSDSPNFCCGDDLNESFREGENICYTSSEDCFFEGSYYADGSYEGDKYCQNGVLTSRTQLIATQLMDVAQQESPTDYVLFCDDFRSALNYVDYVIGEHTAANYFVGYDRWGSPEWVCGGMDKPCANKVCVLKLPDKVVFGASLNKPIEDDPLPFFSTLVGASDCTNGITNAANINDGQFHKCSGSFKLWYNNKTQSVIYSNSDIPIGAINFWDKFLLFLRDPFQKIFNFLVKLLITGNQGVVNVNQAGADYKFINSTSLYSRIYLARNNLKIVRGITEKVEYPKPGEHISVEYRCFVDNIIHTVNAIDQRYMGSYVSGYGYSDRIFSIHNSSLGAYYVVSNSTNGLNLWPELTAKLRIKDTGNYPNTKVYPTIVNVPSSAVFGQEVKFEADIEGCNPPFAYSWNFGDGSVSTLSSPTHNYYPAAEQTYTVSLTVKDSSSPQDIGRATFNIRVLPGVKPVITPDLTNILVGQKTKLGVSDAFSDYTWSIVSGSEYCSISDISGDTKSINLTGNAVGETCKVKAESTQYPAYYDETETLHIVPLTGDLTCNVVPAVQCVESDSKKILFRMSALTNAHAQTTGSYGYAVCCELPGGTLNMGSGAEVISLSSTTNAHVAVDGRYANTIKISSQEKTFYCANATECMANESCVVSISSASNAHAATCNASQGDVYQKKICCGSGAVPTRRCFDDTEIGQCSVNKPQYCDAWQQLVDFCDENIGGCGCPAGEGCLSNGSCAITPQGCSDGTALDTCSANKPKYCNSQRELVDDCDMCGCPAGEECLADGSCAILPQGCSDGTAIDTCSANKPKYCNAQRELVDNCDMCGCTEGGVCLIDGTCDGAEQITTCDELLSIQSDGIYYLTNNIDCSSTPAFGPVADAFNGILDGNNFNITGPHIFRSGTGTVFFAGLFGYLGLNAYIVNLGIIDADVAASGTNGCSEVGILAGRNMGIIENTHVSGTITSSCYIVGGLVGSNDMGTILNSFSSAVVTAGSQIGGLVGSNGGWQEEQGTISESFSLGRILCSGQGLNDVGGLVGYIGGGSIENSFSHTTIDISCHSDIGGFVGYMGGGAVTKSYSTGLIESSLGNGFLGRTALGGAPSTYSYFDLQTSGQTSDAFALPKTTAEMKQQSTFVGWDFESIWAIDPDVNDGYPYLASTGSWT
ncbi:MAG: PKD domain-containing protein, partial [Nanoarchaeota archaeon]|nr:PKD domain-containing protein [Nanoarchaeota archaeon]